MELIWVFVAIAYWLAFATYAFASSPFVNQLLSKAKDVNMLSLLHDQLMASTNGTPTTSNRTKSAPSRQNPEDLNQLLEDGAGINATVHPQKSEPINAKSHNTSVHESTDVSITPLAESKDSSNKEGSANQVVSSLESSQNAETENSNTNLASLTPAHILPSSEACIPTDIAIANTSQANINKGSGETLTLERDHETHRDMEPDGINQKPLKGNNATLGLESSIEEDVDMGSIQALMDLSGSKDQESTSRTQGQFSNQITSELEWPALKPSESGIIDDSMTPPSTNDWPTITPDP